MSNSKFLEDMNIVKPPSNQMLYDLPSQTIRSINDKVEYD